MTKRQKRGWLLVMLGLSMVLAACMLHMTQERQDALAGENADILLQQLQLNRTSLPPRQAVSPEPETQAPAADMAEKDYLGYSMIGTLRIPNLGMELPILSTWSYELLDVAPCRYSGSLPGEDMILMGHNYKSHFTPLHHISEGTKVEFEDVNGIVSQFVVDKTEILHESHIDRLQSEYPLTLLTCTAGGQNRLAVRCAMEKAEGANPLA